jgi:Bacterial Ig-like domain (group 1)
MNHSSRSMARILTLGALLASAAACTVNESGNIPCTNNDNCPADYPTCSAGGFCVPSGTFRSVQLSAGDGQSGVVGAPLATKLTVKALDSNNNPFQGAPISWTVGSGGGSLSAASSTTGPDGTASVTATLGTLVGTNTFSAQSTSASSTIPFTASSVPDVAARFTVSGSSTAVAGAPASYVVTALDRFGNVATGFTGTVAFASTDPRATPPPSHTFTAADKGVYSVPVTFLAAQSTNLSVSSGALVGEQDAIVVSPNVPALFLVTGATSTVAGTQQQYTITVQDAFQNTETAYLGTVTLSSADPQFGAPQQVVFAAADKGVRKVTGTLKTAGAQALNLSGGGVSGVFTVNVLPAGATSLKLTGLGTANVPIAQAYTVDALDPFQNTATGYLGAVHFTSLDPLAQLPADYTFLATDRGHASFQVAFGTTGSTTLTVTDKADGALTSSLPVSVSPGPPSALKVTGPGAGIAGIAGTFVVTALDVKGNPAPSYTGTVTFSSTDSQIAINPSSYTFKSADAGIHPFTVTFKTSGGQTLTAKDAAVPLASPALPVQVGPNVAVSFTVAGFPQSNTAGVVSPFTVTAKDAYTNIATGYAGTVHFTTTNGNSTLPSDYTFVPTTATSTGDGGQRSFSAALKTAGQGFVLTAQDTAPLSTITGSETGIGVFAAGTASFQFTGVTSPQVATIAVPFTLTALDAFGNTATSCTSTVQFSTNNANSTVPADYTFVGADSGIHFFAGTAQGNSLIFGTASASSTTVTAVDAANAALTGSVTGITVNPATAAYFTVQGFPANSQAGSTGSVQVVAYDKKGNQATNYVGTVNLTTNNASSTLPASHQFTGSDHGSFTFTNVALFAASASSTIYATDSAASKITGNQTGIVTTPAGANKVAFIQQPSDTTSQQPITPPVTVAVQDRYGNQVTTSGTLVTASIATNPGGGALGGTTATSTVSGLATFNTLSINKVGTGYTLGAASAGLGPATSAPFNINFGSAASLAFATVSNTTSAQAFVPAVQVSVVDGAGNTVTNSAATVTVGIGTNPAAGTLSGVNSKPAVNGVATFDAISIDKASAGYTLSASSTNPSLGPVASNTFTVAPGQVRSLVVLTDVASSWVSQATSTPVRFKLLDQNLNVAYNTTSTVSVQLGFSSGTNNGALLAGTTATSTVAGIATFDNLNVDKVSTSSDPHYYLAASTVINGGTYSTPTATFVVTPGPQRKLAFGTQPQSGPAGTLASFTVNVLDNAGNLATSATSTVSLGVASGPGSLSGSTSAAPSGGVATFSSAALTKAGTYTLNANAGLTNVPVSSPFTISGATPAKLAFNPAPPVSVQSLAQFGATVQILDQFNNLTNSGATVLLQLSGGTGSFVAGSTSVGASSGTAAFTGLEIDKTGTYTVTATSTTSGISSTSAAVTVTPGAPSLLAFTSQPLSTSSLAKIDLGSGGVQVTVQDQSQNLVGSGIPVTVALGGTSAGGATLGGTKIQNTNILGVATFADLTIDKAANNYQLSATSTNGAGPLLSAGFNIGAGSAAKLVFTTQPLASYQAGQSVSVVVAIEDSSGNPVSTATSMVTLKPTAGSFSGLGPTQTTAGQVSFAPVASTVGLGLQLGTTNTTSLANQTSSAFDVTVGPPGGLAFVSQPPSVATSSTMGSFTVQLQDGFGNTLAQPGVSISATSTSCGTETFAGTTTATTDSSGIATFNNLQFSGTSTASCQITVSGNLGAYSAVSSVFSVYGTADHLVFKKQPASSITHGTTFATAAGQLSDGTGVPDVQVVDALNSVVANSSLSITLSLSGGGGSPVTLTGTNPLTATNGDATFSDLGVSSSGNKTTYKINANAPGMAQVQSASFNVN